MTDGGRAPHANGLVCPAGSANGILVILYLGYINRHLYHVGAGTVGLLGAVAYLVELVAAPPLGALSDRLRISDARRTMLVLSVIAVQATAPGISIVIIGAARVLEALATAAYNSGHSGRLGRTSPASCAVELAAESSVHVRQLTDRGPERHYARLVGDGTGRRPPSACLSQDQQQHREGRMRRYSKHSTRPWAEVVRGGLLGRIVGPRS
ncbi:MAG TPA: hypothetical protein VNL35_19765 [Chloroflexota bacterium]|nr:hypothetical protein [Chloroflexota bacterium]